MTGFYEPFPLHCAQDSLQNLNVLSLFALLRAPPTTTDFGLKFGNPWKYCLYLVYCNPFFEAASSDIKLLFSLACSEPLSNYLILSNQCLYFLLQIPTFPKLFCLLFLCRGGKNSYKGWWLDRWGIVEKVAAGKFHSVRMQPPPTPPQLGIISVNLQNININPIWGGRLSKQPLEILWTMIEVPRLPVQDIRVLYSQKIRLGPETLSRMIFCPK